MLFDAASGLSLDAKLCGSILKYANGGGARSACNAGFRRAGGGDVTRDGMPVVATRDIREHEEIVLFYGDDCALAGTEG